ncbi:hypothetical protein EDD36DRAFT_482755 [Exophiala viscosa]|uniref:Uncharacterized protein n=1 Tax=Exophiala viscosa TaxID=2486360 RepID=A0AAN6DKZ3_9EURO|nr:hypothetical protein EDD36DRAFT_482755 [Exophiala viscosa]
MVGAVRVAAIVLAGENLALNILAGYAVRQSPCWIFPLYIFISHRLAQTILAAIVTTLSLVLRDPDRGIVIPRLSLACEGAVELIYLYNSIRDGLHPGNPILRYEPISCAVWVALKILPIVSHVFVPWRFQSNPFAVVSVIDQALQIVGCMFFCKSVFVKKKGDRRQILAVAYGTISLVRRRLVSSTPSAFHGDDEDLLVHKYTVVKN